MNQRVQMQQFRTAGHSRERSAQEATETANVSIQAIQHQDQLDSSIRNDTETQTHRPPTSYDDSKDEIISGHYGQKTSTTQGNPSSANTQGHHPGVITSSSSRTTRSYVGAGIRYLRKINTNYQDASASGVQRQQSISGWQDKSPSNSRSGGQTEQTQRTTTRSHVIGPRTVTARIGTGTGIEVRRVRDGSGGKVHTAMLASKKSARSGSQKNNQAQQLRESSQERVALQVNNRRQSSGTRQLSNCSAEQRRIDLVERKSDQSARGNNTCRPEDARHGRELDHQINMSQLLSSQVSQPSQMSYNSRNESHNNNPKQPDAISNNHSSVPEEDSFGHPGSFQNLNEPFRKQHKEEIVSLVNENDVIQNGGYMMLPNQSLQDQSSVQQIVNTEEGADPAVPQKREDQYAKWEQTRESNFPIYDAFKSRDYDKQIQNLSKTGSQPGGTISSGQPLLQSQQASHLISSHTLANMAEGGQFASQDQSRKMDSVTSKNQLLIQERVSDLSGKSNLTGDSAKNAGISNQILKKFKSKEYQNLKPVLLENAEKQRGSAESLGRSPVVDSEGRKAALISVRSKNSTIQLRSLDMGNHAKPIHRFQTIGSQNMSSNSNHLATKQADCATTTAMQTLPQSNHEDRVLQEMSQNNDSIPRNHSSEITKNSIKSNTNASPGQNPSPSNMPPPLPNQSQGMQKKLFRPGSNQVISNTLYENAPHFHKQKSSQISSNQSSRAVAHAGFQGDGFSRSNSNATSKQQSVATLNPQMPSPHFPGHSSKMNIHSTSRGELSGGNAAGGAQYQPLQDQENLESVEFQFEQYQQKVAALELKKQLDAQHKQNQALNESGRLQLYSDNQINFHQEHIYMADQSANKIKQQNQNIMAQLQYNQDLPRESMNSIEDSIPIVHLSPHNNFSDQNNTQENYAEASTLTMDGTPHCRHQPPMPQQMPCIEHQSYDCSHYTASPSPDYMGETSSPPSCSHRKHHEAAYHQYVRSLRKDDLTQQLSPCHHHHGHHQHQYCHDQQNSSSRFLQNRREDVELSHGADNTIIDNFQNSHCCDHYSNHRNNQIVSRSSSIKYIPQNPVNRSHCNLHNQRHETDFDDPYQSQNASAGFRKQSYEQIDGSYHNCNYNNKMCDSLQQCSCKAQNNSMVNKMNNGLSRPPHCLECSCSCDKPSFVSSHHNITRVDSYERNLVGSANNHHMAQVNHLDMDNQIENQRSPIQIRNQQQNRHYMHPNQNHPLRVPSMEQNFIIKGQNQDLFSHHQDSHESYMNSTANLGQAFSNDRYFNQSHVYTNGCSQECSHARNSHRHQQYSHRNQQQCFGFYDQNCNHLNHKTISPEPATKLQQNEVSVANLVRNCSDKSVHKASTGTGNSMMLIANNYSIAEEALGILNNGTIHGRKTSRMDRATNTMSKSGHETPLRSRSRSRSRKKNRDKQQRVSSIQIVRNSSKSRSRSHTRSQQVGKQSRSASAPKRHSKIYQDLNSRLYTIKKGKIVRKVPSPKEKLTRTYQNISRLKSNKLRSLSPKLRVQSHHVEPFKPLYNIRDIMAHLGLQNLAHLLTDKGLTTASHLCTLDDQKLKQMLVPSQARRVIIEYMRQFEKHIKSIAKARMFQSWEQQKFKNKERNGIISYGRSSSYLPPTRGISIYRPYRARQQHLQKIRQPPMRFKTVGRDQSSHPNRKPSNNAISELENMQKQQSFIQNQAMFGKTLSNESTIRTRGNCINVQVVRSTKHSQKDMNMSPKGVLARRRSRKDRNNYKSVKPSNLTINSRGGISNLSKSVKGKSKRAVNDGASRNLKSSSTKAKSSKKKHSKSRSRNDERRLTTQSQIEECENIKIVDNQFNNSRNQAKSCISEKSKPSSCLSQTMAISGYGMKMSTKSPKYKSKVASQDFNRQNTSQSDVLGSKRSNQKQKKSSGDMDYQDSRDAKKNQNAGQTNRALTRETSFQAINIDIGGNISNKDVNGQKKLKKILMLKQKSNHGSRTRRASKQQRVVALLKELETLLDEENPDTIHHSSSDAQTLMNCRHNNGVATARGNLSNGSSMNPGQLLSELSRVQKLVLINNDIEGVMPEKMSNLGYQGLLMMNNEHRSSFNNSIEQSSRGNQVAVKQQIEQLQQFGQCSNNIDQSQFDGSCIEQYTKENEDSKQPDTQPSASRQSRKQSPNGQEYQNRVRIYDNDSKITEKLGMRPLNTTSEISETQSRYFDHNIKRESKIKMTMESSQNFLKHQDNGVGSGRNCPMPKPLTFQPSNGTHQQYPQVDTRSSHRELQKNKVMELETASNLISFDNLKEHNLEMQTNRRTENGSAEPSQRLSKRNEQWKKKKRKDGDYVQQEICNKTHDGSPSQSSSAVQCLQNGSFVGSHDQRMCAQPYDQQQYDRNSGPTNQNPNDQKRVDAPIELLDHAQGQPGMRANYLSHTTSPRQFMSVNYWNNNNDQIQAAEVNNILHDLENEQFARGGNIDPSAYKRVLQNLLSNYHRRHFSGGSLGADVNFLHSEEAYQTNQTQEDLKLFEQRRKNSTICLADGQMTVQDIRQSDRTRSNYGNQSETLGSQYQSQNQATSPDFKRQHTTETEHLGPKQSLNKQSHQQLSKSTRNRHNILNQMSSNQTDPDDQQPDTQHNIQNHQRQSGHDLGKPPLNGQGSFPSQFSENPVLSLKQEQIDMFRPNSFFSSDFSSFDHLTKAALQVNQQQPLIDNINGYADGAIISDHQSTRFGNDQFISGSQSFIGQQNQPVALSMQQSQSSILYQDQGCMSTSWIQDTHEQRPHPMHSMSDLSTANLTNNKTHQIQSHTPPTATLVPEPSITLNNDLSRLHPPTRSPYSSKPIRNAYGNSSIKKNLKSNWASSVTPTNYASSTPSNGHSSMQNYLPVQQVQTKSNLKRASAGSLQVPNKFASISGTSLQPKKLKMQCDRNRQVYEKACNEIMDFHAKIQDIERRIQKVGSIGVSNIKSEQQLTSYKPSQMLTIQPQSNGSLNGMQMQQPSPIVHQQMQQPFPYTPQMPMQGQYMHQSNQFGMPSNQSLPQVLDSGYGYQTYN